MNLFFALFVLFHNLFIHTSYLSSKIPVSMVQQYKRIFHGVKKLENNTLSPIAETRNVLKLENNTLSPIPETLVVWKPENTTIWETDSTYFSIDVKRNILLFIDL